MKPTTPSVTTKADVGHVTEFAGAKVNLALRVTGRRDDGYHLLDTLVVHCADIGDELKCTSSDKIGVTVDGPYSNDLAEGDDNLVAKAVRCWRSACRSSAGIDVRLTKNLPIASGIGGGSSDAAATLRALQTLYGSPLDESGLLRCASEIGADCPMCVIPRPARVWGIGERSEAIALPELHVVLANPNVEVSTPDVFGSRDGAYSEPLPALPALTDLRQLGTWLTAAGNDLLKAAESIAPEIGPVIDALHAHESAIHVGMSGSGATCYALFETAAEANAIARTLRKVQPEWWVQAGRTLNGQSA